MSAAAAQAPDRGRPPHASSPPPTEGQRPTRAHRIETAVLATLALLLVAALVNDIVRQWGIDRRLSVDERTFAHYHPGVRAKDMDPIAGKRGKPDLVCSRVLHAPTKTCLIMAGTSHVLYRQVVGGYSYPAAHHDRKRYRFACSGYAVAHSLCPGT